MSVRCAANNARGTRCGLKTKMRFPHCWIHTKKVEHLEVKDSELLKPNGQSIGKGLFTTVDIPIHKAFHEMKGPHRPLDYKDPENEYLYTSKNGFQIDMENPAKSSVGRYSNECHPPQQEAKICDNNAKVNDYKDGTWLVAKKKIKKGTEIMWDYGAGYWDDPVNRTMEEKHQVRGGVPAGWKKPRKKKKKRPREDNSEMDHKHGGGEDDSEMDHKHGGGEERKLEGKDEAEPGDVEAYRRQQRRGAENLRLAALKRAKKARRRMIQREQLAKQRRPRTRNRGRKS